MTKCSKLFLSALLFTVAASAQEADVWKLADLQNAMQSNKGATVINFWATFCKPCIAEIPHFQKLANQYKSAGVNFYFVSLDLKEAYPKKINSFAQKMGLQSPVVYLDESNADLFCPAVDSSWTGSIPATLLFNPQTGYRRFFEEELTKEKLEAEIKRLLDKR